MSDRNPVKDQSRLHRIHQQCEHGGEQQLIIPTLQDLNRENRRRILALKRMNPEFEERALALAACLKDCEPSDPCQSASCAHCAQRHRDLCIEASVRFFNSGDHPGFEAVAITIVPARERVSHDDMPDCDINDFIRRIKRRLGYLSTDLLSCAEGWMDISLNEDERTGPLSPRYPSHFVPHLHLAGLTKDRERLRRALRSLFPSDPVHVLRPTKIHPLDGTAYAMGYFHRIDFDRRTAITDSDGNDSIRKGPLMSCDRDDLQRVLLALGDIDPIGRGFCFRCRLVLTGPSAPTFAVIESPPVSRSAAEPIRYPNKVYATRPVKR
jgi:hypothetical protein